jgi:CBS domain-containing protein
MNVKTILDEKGRDVVTVAPDFTLRDVVAILHQRRIGAVVVVDDTSAIRGILSERDIVRALATKGAPALESRVSETMTEKVVRCTEEHTVNQIMEMMTVSRFRHLPVERDGRLAGIVSIGDVVRKRIEAIEREAEEMKAYIAG